jgi:pimeloyl-ACP methyl ester carboxylesterase
VSASQRVTDGLPQLAGVSHRHVELEDVQLHLAEAGEGPPLLLLHGWPQHWWCWRHLIPSLARSYRVMAVDLRGWGWSSAPAGDYAKSTLANDIVALLDAEGLDRVRVIGHDWGAYVGFLLALEHAERLERLVALDIAPPWPVRPRLRHLAVPALGSYQAVIGAPLLGPRTMTSGPQFVRSVIRLASGPDAEWSDADLDVYADVLRQRARADASSACYRTFLTREIAATLLRGDRSGQLAVPSLLLMGGASALQRVIDPRPSRNLRVEAIPRAGHFLPEEAPAAVLERALPFLAT